MVSLSVLLAITMAAMLFANPGFAAHAYWPLPHAEWDGWTPADLVFPIFLFLVGASIPLSRGATWGSILRRGVVIVAAGLLVSGYPAFDLSHWRIPGVLQRIGICYLVAAGAYLTTSGDRSRRGAILMSAAVFLTLAYWLVMQRVPVPGGVAGDLSPEGNLAAYVDRVMMGGHLGRSGWDPEGLLSTVPAVATTLFGVVCGLCLGSGASPGRKVGQIAASGAGGVVGGCIWGVVVPINRSLWSSSFAVFGAGIAALLVALCYWALDATRGAASARVTSPARPRFGLSRPVWLLGWVSFFTDMASEMVYPLLPLFLTQVLGAGAMSLGVIEGTADAASSGLKILSGWLADRWRSPKKLVLAGYGLASTVRPLIGLATAWPQVFAIRFVDRIGKGIRGAPRDAMLADFASAHMRGRVYGFHRAMDHAGAVTGPLIASAFLYFYPGDYRTLFTLTIIPGLIVILFLLRVPDRASANLVEPNPAETNLAEPNRADPRGTPWHLGEPFWNAMAIILLFSLGNASDAFLLLRLSDLGVPVFWIPLLWSALHVVKVGSSLAGGALSDRFGRQSVIAAGWLIYALVYAGFGLLDSPAIVIAIFLSYGLYFGLTEGVEKAWVADMAPSRARGTAFGVYNATLGIGSLAASLLFGVIWTRVSPQAAFLTGAALAVAASALLYWLTPPARSKRLDETNPRHQR